MPVSASKQPPSPAASKHPLSPAASKHPPLPCSHLTGRILEKVHPEPGNLLRRLPRRARRLLLSQRPRPGDPANAARHDLQGQGHAGVSLAISQLRVRSPRRHAPFQNMSVRQSPPSPPGPPLKPCLQPAVARLVQVALNLDLGALGERLLRLLRQLIPSHDIHPGVAGLEACPYHGGTASHLHASQLARRNHSTPPPAHQVAGLSRRPIATGRVADFVLFS